MSQAVAGAISAPDDVMLATRAARLFYLDDRSKMEIAAELHVSRFKVARLLELARSSGIVTVTITGPGSLDLQLSDRLRDRFGLTHAVVVSTTESDEALTRRQLGTVAANLLTEISTPRDVLGLGWARAVLDMAAGLTDLRVARVVQLTGALTRPDVGVSSVELVRDVARRAGAEPSVFYAPMIVSDAAAARSLLRQPHVKEAFSHFGSVTKAVIGVGGWDPPRSTLYDALSRTERAVMGRSPVHADLSGVLLDAAGRPVQSPLRDRIIGISSAQLRRIPEVIAIAYGLDKVSAAHAALRGGYLHAIVTHTAFAERLLERAGPKPGR
jgi:DNA-binding transcriptional regulator LsrR (DeoR family)